MDKILFQKNLVWDTDSIEEFIHTYELKIAPEIVATIMHDIEECEGYDDIIDNAYSEMEKYTAIICEKWIKNENN